MSKSLPAKSACNIFLLRHFQLLIFSPAIGISKRDDQHQNEMRDTFKFRIWLSGKNEKNGCFNIEIEELTKDDYIRKDLFFCIRI